MLWGFLLLPVCLFSVLVFHGLGCMLQTSCSRYFFCCTEVFRRRAMGCDAEVPAGSSLMGGSGDELRWSLRIWLVIS